MIVRPVVFANVSSQRVQLPGLDTLIVRLIATPPSAHRRRRRERLVAVVREPEPAHQLAVEPPGRIARRMSDTLTRMPPKP